MKTNYLREKSVCLAVLNTGFGKGENNENQEAKDNEETETSQEMYIEQEPMDTKIR